MTSITSSIATSATGNTTVAASSFASSYREYVLAEITCANTRARLWQNDLTAIGIALRAGIINADNALEHLADCGALRLLAPSSAITLAST